MFKTVTIQVAFACAFFVKILHEMDFDAFSSAMSLCCEKKTRT